MKLTLTLIVTLFATASLHAAPDLLIADFEGETYVGWQVEGAAFGDRPAGGSISNQQKVTGFQGKGLVNSFHGGDGSKGVLTSAEFVIERAHINFLIGGGGHENTCIRLLVDGKVVRTTSGPRTSPGGTEALEKASWEVGEFAGKSAFIEIVDQQGGSWGHINVDHIVQSDQPDLGVVKLTRKLTIDAPYLQLPLLNRAERLEEGVEQFTIEDKAGTVLRLAHLKMPASGEEPDFWYSYDVGEFAGREVFFVFRSTNPKALEELKLGEDPIIDPHAYAGFHRPQFHFSPRIGWMNDINGVYFKDGLYHLFYQYNPTTAAPSTGFDMHWGHSVSRDLLHWEEWPVALYPDKNDDKKFSGTAILVNERIPGVNSHAELPTPVLFYTGTATGQNLATSPDEGKTWRQHPANPVVSRSELGGRDPKVIWHEPSKHYVMLFYTEATDSLPEGFAISRSRNLLDWERVGHIPHWYECPEFVPLKGNDDGETVWLLYGFNRRPGDPAIPSAYQLGTFDGRSFHPTSEVKPAHMGPNFYASLVFMGAPDDNPVMMGWARGESPPGEPFNQCATVPLELILAPRGGEGSLHFYPIQRIEDLRGEPLLTMKQVTPEAATQELSALPKNGVYDVVMRIDSKSGSSLEVASRGARFSYDAQNRKVTLLRHDGKPLKEKPLHLEKTMELRLLIDRGIIETFWNRGEASFSHSDYSAPDQALDLRGDMRIEEITVYPMTNVWEQE